MSAVHLRPYFEKGKIWFDRESYGLIARTNGCVICEDLLIHTIFDPTHKKLYWINSLWLEKMCWEEHLEQIIGEWRVVDEKVKVQFT